MKPVTPDHSASAAAGELITATLEAQALLRRKHKVHLTLPKWVHQGLSQKAFASILNDVLRQEFEDLDRRLIIEVRPIEHHSLRTP